MPETDHDEPAESDGRGSRRVRVPGFNPEAEVGLGDVVKRATTTMGIVPCGGCQKRAAAMNRWLVFSGRR